MSKKSSQPITGLQARLGRTAAGFSVPELAKAAGVGINTIWRFERDEAKPEEGNIAKIRITLEKLGVRFLFIEEGQGIIVLNDKGEQ